MDETEERDDEVQITEESVLLEVPPEDAEEVPAAVQETFDWNTSLISQVRSRRSCRCTWTSV